MLPTDCLVSLVTILILATTLSFVRASPITLQQTGEPQFRPNYAMSAANSGNGPPPSSFETSMDYRNQVQPVQAQRAATREDTHTRLVNKPSTSFGMIPSQISNVRPVSQLDPASNPAFNAPSWAPNLIPSTASGAVHRGPLSRPNHNDKLSDHADRLSEGSGAGPLPSANKNHRGKLDDTEDSEDDADDDEDYEDGSEVLGAGRTSHAPVTTTQKPAVLNEFHGDTIRKPPAYNDFYNPFRPAVTTPATVASGNLNYGYNQTSIPVSASPTTTTAPQTTTALPAPVHLPTSRKPMESVNHNAPLPNPKLPTSAKNKTETDYDYDDEKEDEEAEETLVDDNDPTDTDIANNRTNVLSTLPNQPTTNRINATRLELPHPSRIPTTNPPNATAHHQVPSSVAVPKFEPPRPDQHSSKPPFRAPPAIGRDNPIISRPYFNQTVASPSPAPSNQGPNGADDEDDEEEEEEEEEEDEEEAEEDEEDPEDNGSDDDGLPEYKGPVLNRPQNTNANSLSQNNQTVNSFRPVTSAPAPPITTQVNTHVQAIPPARPPSSHGNHVFNHHSTTTRPVQPAVMATSTSPTFSVAPTPAVTTAPTTTAVPTMPSAVVTTTSGPSRLHPFAIMTQTSAPTQTSLATMAPPSTPTPPPPSPPPPSRVSTPYGPLIFPTTVRPYLMSTSQPTRNVGTAVTTNIQPFDRTGSNYSNNDDSLTRQIYDKAVEVYHETDKTVRAALDAVWPPNVNFDSNTLDPLLAQPIFFMLALGGAIICLVLLMMLVVYMISYQTKPRTYERDDISIY